ncbi:MAG: helix-turn-helix domain-containing protein [Acidimicrobiales bacterium]
MNSKEVRSSSLDGNVIGFHIRHLRKHRGMTLNDLSEAVGRPAPYLSQLENGRVEAKLSLLDDLARVFGVEAADLLDPTPPDRRSELELALARTQDNPRYQQLGLPRIKVSSKLSDDVLETIVGLFGAMPDDDLDERGGQRAGDRARYANARLRQEMRDCDNYFPQIEEVANDALEAVGYPGSGPVSERLLTSIAAHFGFTLERVRGMPSSARSVTDQRRRIIYIPDRDGLKVRAARSVVLQTLGHFALDHQTTEDFADYLRQRIESNYFAAAVLCPKQASVDLLLRQREERDISIEDLKEMFYISYEMAAHRFTNLATEFLAIPVHFIRSDSGGVIRKAYENDGIPFPKVVDGTLEGQRIPRQWGTRQAWQSSDSFLLHYQHTTTDNGDFWCATYIENVADKSPYAITIGTSAEFAHRFRGGDTIRRINARNSDIQPDPDMVERWSEVAWPSASQRSHVLTALPAGSQDFTPFPGVDLVDVYRFLDRQ